MLLVERLNFSTLGGLLGYILYIPLRLFIGPNKEIL